MLGFRVYTGDLRSAAIKFCGWTDCSKPLFHSASPNQKGLNLTSSGMSA